MSSTTSPRLLAYANVQMAAEATRLDEVLAGTLTLAAALTRGNGRSSVFTATAATKFASEWTLIAHQPNTDTGFSGTLFRYDGDNNPAAGLVRGQLVMSFRSTEFIDDAVRDNQSTNSMEVEAFGWAFGQIADMRKWFDSLRDSGSIPNNQSVTVTGYSLGGHLATAFNLMFPRAASSTFTFNGAGVGTTRNDVSLATTITDFNQMRQPGADLSHLFSRPSVRSVYQDLRNSLINGARPTDAQRQAVRALLPIPGIIESISLLFDPEVRLLYEAFSRVETIQAEADRIGNPPLKSGGSEERPLVPVDPARVDATDINYQIAVLVAARNTASTNTLTSVSGRVQGPATFANVYDVYGAVPPSAVAYSQLHYGRATPVFIEDQPLWRGSIFSDGLAQSIAYWDVKLLVDRFSENDFGDTHSLVLMVDSLNVQSALAKLDPSMDQAVLDSILRGASGSKASIGGVNYQGYAEGDVLESVVNSLARIFLGPSVPLLSAKMEGGTWANPGDRNDLDYRLRDVMESTEFKFASGKLSVGLARSDRSLAVTARDDFLSFLSLYLLSPFSLRAGTDAGGSSPGESLALRWEALGSTWLADKIEVQAGRSAENITDTYLRDRAAMLGGIVAKNLRNEPFTAAGYRDGLDSVSSYRDVATGLVVSSAALGTANYRRITFGDDAAQSISGAEMGDRLYGGGGNDILSGLGSGDWLEGNGGNDLLDGGDGPDTLYGGADADVLTGGEGDDSLLGGLGADTYNFAAGSGRDVISDADGLGSIVISDIGTLGTNILKVGDNAWQTLDKRVSYTLVAAGASRRDLHIRLSGRNDVIAIQNWTDNALGITLGTTPAPVPSPAVTYAGDFAKKLTGTTYAYVGGNYVANGAQANAADVITGSASADQMSGLGGNDALAGMAGDDRIDGGPGNDLLLGGAGSDTILGGDGMDFIHAAGAGGLTYPLSTTTPPQLAEGPEVARGFDWVVYEAGTDGNGIPVQRTKGADGSWVANDAGNLVDGGAGNDHIDGGPGQDTVHGGGDDDQIDGLGQADILFGDDGNDSILGDGIALPGYWSTVPGDQHGDDLIVGGAGNDSLTGQGGADQIYGGIGNDHLWGDDIDPRFTPYARHGADHLNGGDGDDQLTGGGASDTLVGGEGNDDLFGDWSPDKLPGEQHGSDVLDGGNGADYLEGGGKDDRLYGGAGDDMLWGDAAAPGLAVADTGADELDGGEGNDMLVGGGKSDTLSGGGGDDALAGDGTNTTAGDQGDDLLDGGSGNDTLEGGAGADQLIGGAGADLLQGGDGNDTLVGSGGTDVLQGGDGDDTYVIGAGDIALDATGLAEVIDDSLGVNTVSMQGLSPESMSILAVGNGNLQLGVSNGNTLVVVGGAGGSVAAYQFDGMDRLRSDQLVGRYSPNAVIATGPDGKQRAVGGKNNDQMAVAGKGAVLSGGRGDDTLGGSGGNNSYLYEVGDGLDTVVDTSQKVDSSGAALVNRISFGTGILASELRLSNAAGSGGLRISVGGDPSAGIVVGGYDASGATTGTPIDRFDFADGTSLSYQELIALGFDGTDAAETLVGTSIGDRLRGGRGNDTLAGGLGGDTYQWALGDGSDTIDETDTSTLANDKLRMSGVAATDLTLLRNGDHLLVRFNPTNELISVLGHFAGRGIEHLELDGGIVWDRAQIASRLSSALTEGDDYYTGTTGNDNIAGLGGNDVISGGGGLGRDYIDGGAGNDAITTYGANDTLIGGLGNDTLDSGNGIDLMSGGEGNDVLTSSDGDDTLDGGAGNDRLMAGGGNDTLIDGEDMSGDHGSDTYRLTQWQQARIIEDPTQPVTDVDTLVLPVASADIGVGLGYNGTNFSHDDLNLRASGKSDPITVLNFFYAQGGNNTVEAFRFSDGVTWSAAEVIARAPANATSDRSESVMGFRWNDVIDLKGGNDSAEGRLGNDLINGGAGDDTIYGSEGADTLDGGTGRDVLYGDHAVSSTSDGADSLIGGTGDDTLYGGGGADTLDGGSGADSLRGDGGDDVYAIGLGSGDDQVWDVGGNDRIRLASGIVQADVGLFRDGHDLVVTVRQTAAQTRILFHFLDTNQALERIDFADGSFWDAAAIRSRTTAGTANVMTGTTANDAYTVDNVGDTIAEPVAGGIDTVSSSVSYTLPSNVERLTLTGFVGLGATGNELDNLILGNPGSNRLDGKAGADTLQGGLGDDVYTASAAEGDVVIEALNAGIDTVITPYDYTLPANVENLVGQASNRTMRLVGNTLDNDISTDSLFAAVIDGGEGADTMYASAAHSTYYVDNAGDVILGKEGNVATVFDWTLAPGWYDLALLPGAANGTGNAMANRLFGNGSSTLVGLGGNDSLYGGSWDAGVDIGVGGNHGTSGVDTLIGGLGDDLYQVHVNGAARDVVVELAGEGRDKVVISGTGTAGSYSLSEFANVEDMQLNDSAANSALVGDAGDNGLQGNLGRNLIDGGAGNDRIASNSYQGYVFNTGDTLLGGSGNDTLSSFNGYDVMDGGTGNDTYEFMLDASGRVRFGAGSGTDIAYPSRNMSSSVVELKAGTQGADLRLTRNGSHLVIGLQSAPDTLTWYGYFADDTSYQLGRSFGWLELTPMIQLTATQVASRVQNGNSNVATADDDLLLGGAGADSLSGAGGADQLVGGDGNDTLTGGAGDDALHGGAGNDTYRFNLGDGADWVYEESGSDTLVFGPGIAPADVVASGHGDGMTFVIGAQGDRIHVPLTVDEVRFADGTVWNAAMLAQLATTRVGTSGNDFMLGGDIAQNLRGLAGNDTMIGGAGNDTLDGGAGIDSMMGNGGDDLYIVDTTSDAVTEDPGNGIDTVSASISYTLGANVERLILTGTANLSGAGNTLDNVLTGNAGNNSLSGSSGNDTLDGAAGVDTMSGGAGDDVYLVDVGGDVVTEAAGAGTDSVRASANWTMSANVENLVLLGSALNGTGNGSANTITGNAGNNVLDGAAGNDTLVGGAGDDSYIVDNSADVIIEAAGEGIDTVSATATYTLAANVERLTLLGTAAINGTGNTLDNLLTGNSANNTLNGAAGNDTLDGGAGNDTLVGGTGSDRYVVNATTDVITEQANEGDDTVASSATYTLSNNVEALTLTGTSAINGTGNALDNLITGNGAANTLTGGAGNDTLDGGAGNDSLVGGTGNDTYLVDASGDKVTEQASAGTDVVQSSVTYTLGSNIENLVLVGTAVGGTGNTLNNVITGNAQANSLNGGSGADTMVGGAGNDTYTVDSSGDVITELPNEGLDTVQSSVTLTLAANVENLVLTGTTALNATGNGLDNRLTGNSAGNVITGAAGNDTLDGAAGSDTLVGGGGNDTYVVDVTSDIITENVGEGTDTVSTALAWTLGNHLENLTLTGSSAVNGTGNTLDNVMTGNSAANTLTGGAGNDTLDGGAGNDSLAGGTGSDVYRMGIGYGVDTVSENDATVGTTDAVVLAGNLTQASVQFQKAGNNLEMLLRGTSDKMVFQNWYLGTPYHVERFLFGDGSVLTDTQAQALVGAMASFSSAAAESSIAVREERVQLNVDLAAPLTF